MGNRCDEYDAGENRQVLDTVRVGAHGAAIGWAAVRRVAGKVGESRSSRDDERPAPHAHAPRQDHERPGCKSEQHPEGQAHDARHGDIAREWTVEELGHQAGLSRSALADRFTRTIGMAPMQYLAHWRMHVASQKLKHTAQSLTEIATFVGCDSEAAFSRAFKKAFGHPPATWRRSARPA